ncbi:MAG: SDR family NAD(P)-dependent oxidoreductase, partial [Wenzhouxiangellaceae bacterium]
MTSEDSKFTDSLRLDGQVALVSGASRGIGEAIAARLKGLGADVFGTATSASGAAAIEQRLGHGRGLVLDVRDPDSANACIKKIGQESAAPTILINNAAVTRDQLLMRLKDQDWLEVIETNLTGVFLTCREALEMMKDQGSGWILPIVSQAGKRAFLLRA